ncbi:MAG: ECF transporter S component [Erysipelotrichaceae bacterium]|nr:ECF transporter S component [Erysipelotrichaceae bacterium]
MRKQKISRLALLALFVAIEIILVITPLGYIQIGPLQPTTCHVPVILAALLLGKADGAIMGLVFGLSSMIYGTVVVSPASLFFSPFVSGNILSGVIAIVPRILFGFLAGLLNEIFQKANFNKHLRVILAAVLATVAHTVMVLGMIYVFFGELYASTFGLDYNTLLKTFALTLFSTNCLFEILLAALISWPVVRAVEASRK